MKTPAYCRQLTFLILLTSKMVFGQDFKDSLNNLPFSLNIFDFDTAKVDDIILYEFEITALDTTSKKIITQYKLDSIGRIICARYPYEKFDRHIFYSYKLYPTIYAAFSQSQLLGFRYYSIDIKGFLTNFISYGLHKENIWVQEYNALFKYDSNSKLIEKLVNSLQAKNWCDKYQYYENGYLKKYTLTQDFLNSKDSLMSEYKYETTNNSSHGTFTKQEGIGKIIYDHVVNYDNNAQIISEIEITTEEKLGKKEIFNHFFTTYEYDYLGRQTKSTVTSFDKNGNKEPWSTVKLYHFNTLRIPNLRQINEQNCPH